MKLKIKAALFMFALGLGSASVYAETPQHQCQTQCYKSYKLCNGGLVGEINEYCQEQLISCLDYCDSL
ncbi:hypothetical protein ACFOLJ_07425 [Rugamonas sp. CCM 8940]|uniref:hypothetical protein n=1 Tax=Rugamonas sp. CCM 8940 TaxID=2765359 RepID=UPI0018F4C437|nr:hypothetical protein [Rugamonas sp. CCM 8940]MBJ7310218.1 hypothetical protein [Rugamonas sp. CCM 8940]